MMLMIVGQANGALQICEKLWESKASMMFQFGERSKIYALKLS